MKHFTPLLQDRPSLAGGLITPLAILSQYFIPIYGHLPKEVSLALTGLTYFHLALIPVAIFFSWVRASSNLTYPAAPLNIISLLTITTLTFTSWLLKTPLYLAPALAIIIAFTLTKPKSPQTTIQA